VGEVVSVTAVPDEGYVFTGWSGTAVTIGQVSDPSAASISVTISADYTLEAHFVQPVVYTLQVASTSGGSVTDPGEGPFDYNAGASVRIEAVAEAGYRFDQWDGQARWAGKVVSPYASATWVKMYDDYTLVAKFKRVVTLSFSSSSGGSVTIPGEGQFDFDAGKSVSIAGEPEADYSFIEWTGSAVDAGKVADPSQKSTVVEADDDYTLKAHFDKPTSAILHVDCNASAGGDGSSWGRAFKYLQDALDASFPNQQIWVAEGVYKPDEGSGQNAGDRSATFEIDHTVFVFGGFGVGGGAWEDRNPAENRTTLSGDLNGDDGSGGDNGDNSYHVVSIIGTDSMPTLDGFVITGGNASAGPYPDNAGGGIFNPQGQATVDNCRFVENRARINGGAVYSGLECNSVFSNCVFRGNTSQSGGAFKGDGASVMINCIFVGNSGMFGGGGYIGSGGTKVINCVFSGNSASAYGGAIYVSKDSPTVSNCTFSGNSANNGGGMWCGSNTLPTVTNCIFWGNTCVSAEPQIGGSAEVSFCDVQGGRDGTGNIDADPLFFDADGADNIAGTEDDDLRIVPGSACIDAGDSTAVGADIADLDGDGDFGEKISLDLAGNGRIVDSAPVGGSGVDEPPYSYVDMGAYELRLCEVGMADMLILAEQWLGVGEGFTADLDANNRVDLADFAELSYLWYEVCPVDWALK
jgi:predicted outer membrane repeat protein